MWNPLRPWSPTRQWLDALVRSVATAYEALQRAASADPDPRAWMEPWGLTVCIRPRRDEAARAFGENAA
jgi:hypothetical protein